MIAELIVLDDSPIETLEPTARANGLPGREQGRPPILDSLQGKTMAVIDSDSPGDSESYFARALIRRMQEAFGVRDVIWVKKDNRTHPPQPELWQEVTERADIGIAMYGGCGTCSSRTMRDAIEMEWAGIPSVAIAHEDLRGAIDAMRTISKATQTPYVLIPRPLTPSGDWGVEATDDIVDRILPRLATQLTLEVSMALKSA